jgi:pyridoxamine 5'-phosphate oxidase
VTDTTVGAQTPSGLLRAWLPANTDPQRPTMTLASVDAEGYPDARTVLLSEVDDDGIHFQTDSRSRKVAQLAADPRACATVLLDDPPRQLVLRGEVSALDPPTLLRAYRRRSRYLQVLAWLDTAELAREPVGVRREAWRKFEERHPGELDPPPTWVGYRLRAERLSFWIADDKGPSVRLEFERAGEGWSRRWLPG